MRTDHRRPLAAFGLVALACAMVMWQSSLGASVAGRAPVVMLLTDIGLSPSELLGRVVVGDLFDLSPVAAPEDELPDAEPDLAEDLLTPSQFGVPEASGGTAPAVALETGLVDADGGGGPVAGGSPTPGVGPGQPDDDATPETGAPHGGKGTASGHGHSGKGPKDQADGHPGKGPKDKADGHPGKEPKDQADGHPGQGPKDKGDGHPGKGPKDKGQKNKGQKNKGQKNKGQKNKASNGHGPKGVA